jgi:hypothetical protein
MRTIVVTEAQRLPIIVTVSGHRDLRPLDEAALRDAVRLIFKNLGERYPTTPLILLTPLAVGADRLVARVAIELGIRFRVPMPLPEAEYRRDFSPAENAEFDELINAEGAGERYAMPYVGDNTAANVTEPERRARQYAMVGAYIARVSHILIALWNGKPSASVGGTAQIVEYRLRGAPEPYRNPMALLDAPDSGPVYHVVTPRRSDPETDEPAGTLSVIVRRGRIAPSRDPYRALYARVERFNDDVAKNAPRDGGETSATSRLQHVAEHLATYYQHRHHRALNLIFGLTTLAALMLALGNFHESTYSYPLWYAGLIIIGLIVYRMASGGQWQDRFIEYRALELGLMIQRTWDLAGVDASVADMYLRLQRSELDWVREAIRAMHHLDRGRLGPLSGLEVMASVRAFVEGQHDFFRRTGKRDQVRCERFELATLLFFVAGGLFALTFCGAIVWHALYPSASTAFLGWLEDHRELIAMAAILAAVSHEYPRRRAFHAQSRRYAAMFRIYERALSLLDEARTAPPDVQLECAQEVAREIGREALAENGDWVLMHRELPIEMLHV